MSRSVAWKAICGTRRGPNCSARGREADVPLVCDLSLGIPRCRFLDGRLGLRHRRNLAGRARWLALLRARWVCLAFDRGAFVSPKCLGVLGLRDTDPGDPELGGLRSRPRLVAAYAAWKFYRRLG